MKLRAFFITGSLVMLFACAFAMPVFASTTNGTISGYAWGDELGWINFGCTNCSGAITDSVITGYAWSQNYGWIKLDPTNSGIDNNAEGTLSGKAWGEQIGWINFAGVTVNSSGDFAGTATVDNGGSISFGCTNCTVSTDWRPASTRAGGGGGGGGGSVSGGTPIDYNSPPWSPAPTPVADTVPPFLAITQIETAYEANQSIIVSGTGEAGAFVQVSLDNGYASFYIDNQGNWVINLGNVSAGAHRLLLTPADAAGNIGKTVAADFVVKPAYTPPMVSEPQPPEEDKGFTLIPPLGPIFKELAEGIKSLLPDIFKPLVKVEPPPLVIVPKDAPPALQGQFRYLSSQDLSRFVLAPLPTDIALLAQKIPQLEKTFNQLGINKVSDVQKLQNVSLKLPALAQIEGDVPSGVLFAKAASGLIDYQVALSVNNKGKAEQSLKTLAGQQLELVVKTPAPAKRVSGYMALKSKTYHPPVSKGIFSMLLASLSLGTPAPNEAQEADAFTLSQFEYVNTGDNVYTARVQAPVVDGTYEIVTITEYQDSSRRPEEMRLITLVDPEGYIYEKSGRQETRITGATVSMYWLNPETTQYELWPAKEYLQENPQVTDQRGTYSFLVPEGQYYLKVDAPGYKSYSGEAFAVSEGSGVHANIELTSTGWWLKVFDWKTLLLVVVVLLLLYNFYKNRRRTKVFTNKKYQ